MSHHHTRRYRADKYLPCNAVCRSPAKTAVSSLYRKAAISIVVVSFTLPSPALPDQPILGDVLHKTLSETQSSHEG